MRYAQILVIFFCLSTGLTAAADSKPDQKPFVLALFFDLEAAEWKSKFLKYLSEQPPFKKMLKRKSLIIIEKELDIKAMGCYHHQGANYDYMYCNNNYLASETFSLGAHKGLVISSRGRSGYGGISFWERPFAVVATRMPLWVGLHEFLHTLGFEDEYSNTYSRFPDSCAEYFDFYFSYASKINVVYFDINRETQLPIFTSDADARKWLKGKISWLDEIPQSTPVTTNGKLGTPRGYERSIGLYPGGMCNTVKYGFVPYNSSIMASSGKMRGLYIRLAEKVMLEMANPPAQ